MVRRLAGTMFIKDLARAVGTSDSNLDRWAKQNGVNINALSYRPAIVRSVCAYYEKHGRVATQDAFPNIRVRSIVEKHKGFRPRQERWSDEQIVQLAKFGGLISFDDQARFFNRPRANAGSIKSAWMKKFKIAGGSINGMSHVCGRELVTKGCPIVRTKFWETRRKKAEFGRKLYLWIDMEKYLRPEVPEFIADAIGTLAKFQRWLHGKKNTRANILKIIQTVGHGDSKST